MTLGDKAVIVIARPRGMCYYSHHVMAACAHVGYGRNSSWRVIEHMDKQLSQRHRNNNREGLFLLVLKRAVNEEMTRRKRRARQARERRGRGREGKA